MCAAAIVYVICTLPAAFRAPSLFRRELSRVVFLLGDVAMMLPPLAEVAYAGVCWVQVVCPASWGVLFTMLLCLDVLFVKMLLYVVAW